MAYKNDSDSQYVEFKLGKDMAIPEHEGEEFDMVCTFRDKGDGRVCMTKFGEHDMPEPPKDEGKEEEPSHRGLAQSIVADSTAGPSSSTMDSSY